MRDAKFETKDYQVYIVDMDGTLYFKRLMQIRMALRLLWHYLIHIFRLRELFILYSYRKLRDRDDLSENSDFEDVIIQQLSKKYRCSKTQIQKIVSEWILTRPLEVLFSTRDNHLITFLRNQRKAQKKVYIYSDYPAIQKCAALGVQADDVYWPDGERISVLKPAVQGLNYIIKQNHLEKSQILFIGDRLEKDGVCAQNAGVDYLILKKNYQS